MIVLQLAVNRGGDGDVGRREGPEAGARMTWGWEGKYIMVRGQVRGGNISTFFQIVPMSRLKPAGLSVYGHT